MCDVSIILTSLRCRNCHRVFWDADIRVFGGCPHCGCHRMNGSGNTTTEEENWLEKWAERNYDKYREIEVNRVGERLRDGGFEREAPTAIRGAFGGRAERGACAWAAGTHSPRHLPKSTGYPGRAYPVLGEQVEKAAEAE